LTLSPIIAASPRLARVAGCLSAAVGAAAAVREPTPIDEAAPATSTERDREELFAARHSFVGHDGRTRERGSWLRASRAQQQYEERKRNNDEA
jgi:hypothetical protein